MDIEINGRPSEAPEGATVASLLESMGLSERRVAVELNGDILPRARYAETTLGEGDRIEVVHFVGGG